MTTHEVYFVLQFQYRVLGEKMAKKVDSDQTLTTDDSAQESLLGGTGTIPKVRSGIFGIISLVSAVLLIGLSVFGGFGSNGQIHLDASTDITINLKLTSEEFLVISKSNVCDGIGSFPGIKTSKAIITSPTFEDQVAIGSGQLNNEGSCEYTITVPTPEKFKGGSVDFLFKFPFGESRVFTIDVGDSVPYKNAIVEIPFD